MMNHLFCNLINRSVLVIYMNDLLIFTKMLEEHNLVIEEVLKILKDNDLFLKVEKCVWHTNKVEFVSMDVSDQGIHMSQEKVDVIKSWNVPVNVKGVRKFLGFTNYYRRFIKDFSKMTRPLVDLICKDTPWKWGDA